MTDEKPAYRMKVRAEQQAATHLRITESAVQLHGTIGPSRTTMSAVAQHAGVRRSTLYRHFPDETALFVACSSHWATQHPLPDLEQWATVRDPAKRLNGALTELYAYYEQGEPMLSNLVRDIELVEAVGPQFARFLAYIDAAHETLMTGRGSRRRTAHQTQAAIGHALAFTTWRSLVREQGCTQPEAIEMMSRMVGP